MTEPEHSRDSNDPASLHELTMKEERIAGDGQTRSDYRYLGVRIADSGDLVMEGQDLGRSVAEFFGGVEYEFSRTVRAAYKDAVLLWLIKERFSGVVDFGEWLDEKGIPSEFWSRLED